MTQQTIPPIRPEHLKRSSVVYIRQSTDYQARHNTGSTAWQYGMVDEAIRLGWVRQDVIVIDEDQGQSGAEYFHREGFKWMFDEVAAGRIGSIICTEVSRLSRDSGDWNILLKVCRATDTLVADENRVYDLSNYSDRFCLNITGSMGEAERDLLIMRSRQASLAKAKLGELMIRVPTGYIADKAGKYHKDHSKDKNNGQIVSEVISLVFELFDRLGTGNAVLAYFNREKILFPNRMYGRVGDDSLTWTKFNGPRCYAILKNPIYAGAYVFGRTTVKTRVVTTNYPRVEKYRGNAEFEDWAVIKLDNHEGYTSWEKFLENREKLKNNLCRPGEERRGAPRAGAALLQGNAFCGICNHRISVHYSSRHSQQPTYCCMFPQRMYSAGPCQAMPARAIDTAVEKEYLKAVAPANLELALRTDKEAERHAENEAVLIQLRLNKVRNEADLTKRRFMNVDPENRLVAQQLEREWNDKLAELNRLETDFARGPRSKQNALDAGARKQLMELSKDLPDIWRAETTSQVERKQLLGFLIERVNITRMDEDVFIEIRWRTGAVTRMKVPLQLKRTQRHVIDLVRKLAADHTDQEIVEHLNREGIKSARGHTFTVDLVEHLRYSYSIPIGSSGYSRYASQPQRSDGRYRARAAALVLETTVGTVNLMCKDGRLDCVQDRRHTPWWVHLPAEKIPELKVAVTNRRKKRKS